MTSYTVNIPQSSDYLAESQPQLLAINSGVNTASAVDHVAFNASSNAGKHKQVTFTASASPPTTGATESAIYSALVGSNYELFHRLQSDGATTQITDNGSLTIIGGSTLYGIRGAFRVQLGASPAYLGTPFNNGSVSPTLAGVGRIEIPLATALTDTNGLILVTMHSPQTNQVPYVANGEFIDTSNIRVMIANTSTAGPVTPSNAYSFSLLVLR